MSWLRNQSDDWKYLVSKDNKTSRGFYLFVTAAILLILIACVAAFVLACTGRLTGVSRITGFIALPCSFIVIGIVMKLLSK